MKRFHGVHSYPLLWIHTFDVVWSTVVLSRPMKESDYKSIFYSFDIYNYTKINLRLHAHVYLIFTISDYHVHQQHPCNFQTMCLKHHTKNMVKSSHS